MIKTTLKRSLFIVVSVLIIVPTLELARECVAYVSISRSLETSNQRIALGMRRDRVVEIAGNPDSVSGGDDCPIYYWSATDHQGPLWRLLGLTQVKGHRELTVSFDKSGCVTQFQGGVN